jgi:putative endonuclease
LGQIQQSRISEDQVAKYLEDIGWTILARNKRYRGSELDIVAIKKQTLCIVEVKSRAVVDANTTLLTLKKRQALKRGADRFIAEHQYLLINNIRFDLALVDHGRGRLLYYKDI